MYTPLTVIAAIAAGIAGTAANSWVVATLVEAAEFEPLMLSYGRLGVAVAVALLLPLIYRFYRGPLAWLFAGVVLAIVPTILAQTVFDVPASTEFALAVNAVYAAAAVLTFGLLMRLREAAVG